MKKYTGFLSALEKEIAQLNEHMPRSKKTLSQLLSEKAPAFTTRDGQRSAVRREEIETLAAQIPQELHEQIQLPFTVLRRTSLGPGAHVVGGSKLDQFTVFKILGKIEKSYSMWRECNLPRIIYSPEVAILRRKLPTTLTIGFGT
ncbi:MAG: DUF61 family protein [Candidatus Hodarchaeota archaeon]